MLKEITIGVSSAVFAAGVLGFLGYLGKIPLSLFIPKNAVVAFHSDNCPENGWSIYTPAYGRFIRGIDLTGSKDIDPDGKRYPGKTQEDMLKEHSHQTTIMFNNEDIDGVDSALPRSYEHRNKEATTGSTGGEETRPKNVALLYCRKD